MTTDSVLENFYCQRASLNDYLEIVGKLDEATPAVVKLSKKIIICAKHDGSIFPRKITQGENYYNIEDIIHHVIESLLMKKTPNIITQGYRFRTEFSKQSSMKVSPNVVIVTPNSTVEYLTTRTWASIQKCVGDDLFYYLISNTSIFASLPRKCFMQLTGIPVSDLAVSKCIGISCSLKLPGGNCFSNSTIPNQICTRTSTLAVNKRKRKLTVNETDNAMKVPSKKIYRDLTCAEPLCFRKNTEKNIPKRKRRKFVGDLDKRVEKSSWKPTYIRSKIFYSKSLSEGFRKDYILNKIKSSNSGILVSLNSMFSIKTSVRRTPKHLLPISKILKKVVALFKKIRFRCLLNHHCPLPKWFKSKSIKQKERNTVLEKIRYKLAVQSFVPVHKVFLFMRNVVKKLLRGFFENCPENEKIFMTGLKRFIFLGRYEKLAIEKLTATFKTTSFSWLTSSQSKRKHPQQQSRDANIVRQFMLWLYNSLVIPLLSSFFYVTETSCHRNRVFYYRKPVWNVIQKEGLHSLTETMYKEFSPGAVEESLSEKSCLGVYEIRLLPSLSKIRPIANMSKCYSDREQLNRVFINHLLKPVFLCLRFEIDRNPCLGATVSDSNTVYHRFSSFLTQVKTSYETLPSMFYIATIDISRCFDSLPQERVLELIPNILKEDSYSVKKFTKVQMKSKNFVSKRLIQYACQSYNGDNCVDFVKNKFKSGTLQCYNTIFIERPCSSTYNREDLMSLLTKHLKNSIGRYGGKYFLQHCGVPQGSILATILNNILLGHIERTELHNALVSSDKLLMRWVDDYIFVALSETDAVEFIISLKNAMESFGYSINFEKSAVNFDAMRTGLRLRRISNGVFNWCGYVINEKTLEVSYNYEQYVGENIRDFMTIEHNVKPAQAMCRKLLLAVSVKATPLIVDTNCNSDMNQHLNIYQVFRYIALRFYANFKVLSRDRTLQHRVSFYMSVIEKVHETFFRCCTRNFKKSKRLLTDENFVNSSDSFLLSLTNRTQWNIDRDLIRYLCYQAFIDGLQKKQTNLGILVSSIKSRINVLKQYNSVIDISYLRKQSTVMKNIKTN